MSNERREHNTVCRKSRMWDSRHNNYNYFNKRWGMTLHRENHHQMKKKKKKSNVCGLVNRSTWAVIFLVYFPMVSSFISSACITLEKEGMFYSQSCASHSFQKALAPISPGSPHTNKSVCRCLMSPSWVQWDQHWKLAPRGEQEPTIVSMLNDVGLALMTQGIL